jgi:hypothetical protein
VRASVGGTSPRGRVASLGPDGRTGHVALRRLDASTALTSGARRGRRPILPDTGSTVASTTLLNQREEAPMADKSPRQHQAKKPGKTLKEKRGEKKAKQATKRPLV